MARPGPEVEESAKRAKEMIATESRLIEIVMGDSAPDEKALACGKVHEIANDHQLAEGFYREALRHSPENLEALARLAIVLMKRGDVAEGLAVARQLEESNANFAFETITGKPVTAMTVLADALRLNGQLSNAKAAYEKSINLTEGKDRHSLGHFADGLLREGQAEEAVAVLTRFAIPDELDRLNACASLLRKDPTSVTSFRTALHLDGSGDDPP